MVSMLIFRSIPWSVSIALLGCASHILASIKPVPLKDMSSKQNVGNELPINDENPVSQEIDSDTYINNKDTLTEPSIEDTEDDLETYDEFEMLSALDDESSTVSNAFISDYSVVHV